jgi:LmbE family N-acetylglucosaminyl deacetylase
MLSLALDRARDAPLRVLCLGAHGDDIEIGCGGTLLRLLNEYPRLDMQWIVFGAHDQRIEEAYASAEEFLKPVGKKKIVVKDFKDGFFPYAGAAIKLYFEQLKEQVSPDIIFTHFRHDLHQDHRLLCELTWNTFRNHLILEYEIPKYDGDLGAPNFFVHLDEQICRRKIAHILRHFKSQESREWFTEDTFLSILRLRGVESRSPYKYAEAFYCRKIVWGEVTRVMISEKESKSASIL